MSTKFATIDQNRIHLVELRLRSELAEVVQLRVEAARGAYCNLGAPLSETEMALLDKHGVPYTVVKVLP